MNSFVIAWRYIDEAHVNYANVSAPSEREALSRFAARPGVEYIVDVYEVY